MRTKRGTITKNSTHVENVIKEYYYQQLVSTSNLDKQIPWEKTSIPSLTQEVLLTN